MQVTEKTETFIGALNVINVVLEKHNKTFPYKQICGAGEKLLGGKNLGVAVYADDPTTPHDYYTICWQNGKIELVDHGKKEPFMVWKVPESYIQDIVDNAEEYIKHPAKLDLDWITSRLGSKNEA